MRREVALSFNIVSFHFLHSSLSHDQMIRPKFHELNYVSLTLEEGLVLLKWMYIFQLEFSFFKILWWSHIYLILILIALILINGPQILNLMWMKRLSGELKRKHKSPATQASTLWMHMGYESSGLSTFTSATSGLFGGL